jgi:hypothetical protein
LIYLIYYYESPGSDQMHKPCLTAVLAAAALGLAGLAMPQPASADGPGAEPVRKHHVRTARSVEVVRGLWPGGPDPYAYAYARTRYYPYYNSAYWVPLQEMRYRTRYPNRLPGYASSWGYPLTCKLEGGRQCGVPYQTERAFLHSR